MVNYIGNLEQDDAEKISKEIAYMLHCHNRDQPSKIQDKLHETAKDIDPTNDSFNQNVMAALIKSGYLQNLMKVSKTYPKFLTAMLRDDSGEDQ